MHYQSGSTFLKGFEHGKEKPCGNSYDVAVFEDGVLCDENSSLKDFLHTEVVGLIYSVLVLHFNWDQRPFVVIDKIDLVSSLRIPEKRAIIEVHTILRKIRVFQKVSEGKHLY